MDNLIYMDNAATTYPKPREVYDFMHDFYQKHGVNPGRSGYDMTLETEEVVHSTRKMLTEFFNGTDPNRLTFSYNASDSLNMIIDGMFTKGDHPGTIGFRVENRHRLGTDFPPQSLGAHIGAGTPTALGFGEFNFALAELYYEQQIIKDHFVVRLGKMLPFGIYDFFLFKNPLNPHRMLMNSGFE